MNEPTLWREATEVELTEASLDTKWRIPDRPLVPVEPCEHGNIDPHEVVVVLSGGWETMQRCPGSPTLAKE